MTRSGVIVPAETSVLCEGCGYTLDGLPATGQCPECGLPIAASTGADGRVLPAWEDVTCGQSTIYRFISTSAAVVFAPGRFYRTLATRRDDRAALKFAKTHWALSAIFFAGAAAIHQHWYETTTLGWKFAPGPWAFWFLIAPLTYAFLWGTTRLAARLTAWEAAYRGIRLPLPVVLRSLYYHAAHFLPVALIAFTTVLGHYLLLKWKPRVFELQGVRYLLVLSAEVVISAIYLFKTYWTGMRNTMYANR
jgi:ribosomal protein S27E